MLRFFSIWELFGQVRANKDFFQKWLKLNLDHLFKKKISRKLCHWFDVIWLLLYTVPKKKPLRCYGADLWLHRSFFSSTTLSWHLEAHRFFITNECVTCFWMACLVALACCHTGIMTSELVHVCTCSCVQYGQLACSHLSADVFHFSIPGVMGVLY